MELKDLRCQIDRIDEDLIDLLQQRMDLCAEIAHIKKERKLPVYDPAREREKLHELCGKVTKDREAYITALYSLLFELSRTEQERIINQD